MKNFFIEIKWGVIFIIVGLIWVLFEKMMGWHDEHIDQQAIYSNLFGFIAVFIYFLGLRDKKKNYYNGVMDWKQGFVAGVVITVVVALLSPLSQYITSVYISPNYFSNMITYISENSAMTREQAEAFYNLKSTMIQVVFSALAMGVVTSALIAWFVKSKNPAVKA